MISKDTAQKVLNAALKTGGDFAEIYAEKIVANNLTMDNGKIIASNTSVTSGVGIRILKQLQSVYGYTNDISEKGLTNLADSLSKSYVGSQQVFVKDLVEQKHKNQHTPKVSYLDVSKKQRQKLMLDASNAALQYDKRIVRCEIRFGDNKKEVQIFNSDGKIFCDQRERGRAFITCFASEEGKIETFYEGPGAQKGFEFFTDEIDMVETAKTVAKKAVMMLSAEECPSGKMDVVIGNGFGGVIFHEACGHALEATSVAKGLSVFAGKKGQKIASDIVSAVDDGTIENAWGSGNVDDEGNPTNCNLLIKDGILNSYLVDDFNGRRMNEKGNGATRRESYKYEPTSRMSNTFILNGKSTPEQVISSVKKGLYAKSMGGGSVNPTTGDFNFACLEAYLIEDGKITVPVKGATLIGNGAEILHNIDMIANDLKRAQGMCGSASGSIPTDVGQPTIRVKNITVGGRGGKAQ